MRDCPDVAMMFCAGLGTRMGNLTRSRPKPPIDVGGKPLAAHALSQLERISRVVANTHYKRDLMETWLDSAGIESIYEPELLETGGGLKNALPLLASDCVLTINTDAVWSGPTASSILCDAWDPERMDALLLLVPLSRTHAFRGKGDFDMAAGRIEKRGGPFVYTGAQILRTNTLDSIAEDRFSLNLVWEELLAKGRLHGVEYPGDWVDVGHPDGITEAEGLLG